MSDKSHDAEPPINDAPSDDPESLEAEAAAVAESDDAAIAELEENLGEDDAADDDSAAPAPIKRKTAKAPVKKTAPTKKRDDHKNDEEDQYRAKNPVHFAKQSAGELKKVVWPTWPQLRTMFVAVLVFVLIIILIVSALDAGFGALLLWLFGR